MKSEKLALQILVVNGKYDLTIITLARYVPKKNKPRQCEV